MIQGTTPVHTFSLGAEFQALTEQGLESLYVTYAQLGSVVVDKTLDDVSLEEGSVVTSLTQEETLQFNPDAPVEIQIRFLTRDNQEAYATNILTEPVERVLKAGVI